MYVTRRISELRKNPKSLSEPPEGPNSGYLVIKDEETIETCNCFGFKCSNFTNNILEMPVPQNMDLTLEYTVKSGSNEKRIRVPIIFIPVLNQPLSSNTYYAIQPQGEHKGKALVSSEGEYKNFLPVPLNPRNAYQHMKIVPYGYSRFNVESVVSDGFRPYLDLPPKAWSALTSTPYHFELHEAPGVDSKLRARLPNFTLSIICKSSKPVVVGKWYVPFMFVKDGRLRDQVERSLYYHVTLERKWEQIYTCKNNIDNDSKGNLVEIDVEVENQEVFIDGNKALWSEKNTNNGVVWFTSYGTEGGDLSVGLRVEVVERMKWEQVRGGWKGGNELKGRVNRAEEFMKGKEVWTEFGCYVLVERFKLRRMDGSLAMAYDFKHIHQIKTLWE